MDLVESGAIFNFKPFNLQTSRDNGKDETLNSSLRSTSRTNSRFEELFLASPRAQELVSTIDQSLSFSTSRSRIISPNKQQSLLHESLTHTPFSTGNPGKNNLTNSGGLIVNMLECFRSGQQPQRQVNPSQDSWFSPVKASNYDEDSLRTQVTDVIKKLRTPIDRKRRKDEDGFNLSLNTDSGYDDRQTQSYNDSIADDIDRRGSLTSNDPQRVLPGSGLEIREENNNEVGVPEPDIAVEAVQDEDLDVVEFNQQNDQGTENVESTRKQSTDCDEELMDCNVGSELGIPDIPEIPEKNPVQDEIKEPIPAKVKSSNKAHHLFRWYIKAIKTKQGPSVMVEGQRLEDPVGELWHSTGIVNRVSSSQVETKSSQYVLEGEILAKEALEQGFSKHFVEAFNNGFPSNWKQLVQEHFDSILDNSPTKAEQARKSSIKKQSTTSRKPQPKTSKTPNNAGLRPIEVELKRTSSGRLIKPPLAWWRGQRIVTDSQHNLTAIEPGGEEHTALSIGMYDFDLKLPKNKASLLKSTPMTPKVAKYDVTTKTTIYRENQRTKTKGNVAESTTHKRTVKNTETSSLDSSESESTDDTSDSRTKPSKDLTSEKPSTSLTDSDASSFPKVMRPKLAPSESSWKPSDSDSTAKISSRNTMPKSRKPQERGNKRVTRSRKQHSEFSTEESADNEEEEDDVDMLTKDNVKRNISFSDDEFDSKSSQQKIIQKKGSITSLKKKEKNKMSSNPVRPLKEIKVVLEKNHRVTRHKQMKNQDHDSDSTIGVHNDESNAVNSSKDVFKTNTTGSSEFRKPHTYTRNHKKKSSEVQSCTESSSEENAPQRRSLRKGNQNQEDRRNKNFNYKINNEEHKRGNSHGTRKRDGLRKHKCVVEEDESNLSSSDGEEAQAVADMLSNVRQKKAVAENQASEATSDDDSPKKKSHNRTARKTKNQRSKSGSSQDKNPQKKKDMHTGDEDDGDGRDWKDDEIFRLSEALHSIPLSTPRYWKRVSELVETRTAQECQLKYAEQLYLKPRKVVKPKEKQPKAYQKVVAITGGVGTIKRKRELRQLIQQNNDGYEDDIFESTPYKNTTKKFKFFTDQNNEDSNAEENEGDGDDDDNDGDDEEHNHMNFKTPSSRTPSSRYRPLGPAGSLVNTPGSDLISPSLLQPVNRDGMDHYIYRMKQTKKGVGQYRREDRMKVVTTSTPKKKTTPMIPKPDASLFDVQEVLEQDSDEENDYYWSDE